MNVFENCPSIENEDFRVRLIRVDDVDASSKISNIQCHEGLPHRCREIFRTLKKRKVNRSNKVLKKKSQSFAEGFPADIENRKKIECSGIFLSRFVR